MVPMPSLRLEPTTESPMGVLDDASWVRRAMLIEQVAERYLDRSMTQAQRRAAEDVFRVALYDGEPLVRCVLADSLKRLANVPRDIMVDLAGDEAQVARPVLRSSPVLTDEDLVRIAREGGRAHRLAIAERQCVSLRVAETLYATLDANVVCGLLGNDGAAIAEGLLHAILDTMSGAPGIVEAMARRRLLPVSIMDRLVHYGAAEELRPYHLTRAAG